MPSVSIEEKAWKAVLCVARRSRQHVTVPTRRAATIGGDTEERDAAEYLNRMLQRISYERPQASQSRQRGPTNDSRFSSITSPRDGTEGIGSTLREIGVGQFRQIVPYQ